MAMKALHYDGPFKVSIQEVEKPKIQHPDDVIIKVSVNGVITVPISRLIRCPGYNDLHLRFGPSHVRRTNCGRERLSLWP